MKKKDGKALREEEKRKMWKIRKRCCDEEDGKRDDFVNGREPGGGFTWLEKVRNTGLSYLLDFFITGIIK